MFSFLHAADIHLDSPLKGLARYEGAPADEIRQASRRALENLVELAQQQQVKFVLIAGDLYDGDWPDHNTGLFFLRQVARLHRAGISVYVIQGNHDAESKMTRSLQIPSNPDGTNVLLAADACQTVLVPSCDVALHGRGFQRSSCEENLAESYPAARPGLLNIGILHTSLDDETAHAHARYAPCRLDDLRHKQYDYWALGHVHQRGIRSERPWVVYPGNIQGRHARETGPKGCYLVHVNDRLQLSLEFQPLDVVRWEHLTLELDNLTSDEELLSEFGTRLSARLDAAPGKLLAIRTTLSGCTAWAELSQGDRLQWTNQLRSEAIRVGGDRVWLEKVLWEVTSPAGLLADGPLAELSDLVQEVMQEEGFWQQAAPLFSDLMRKLPPTMRQEEAIPDWSNAAQLPAMSDRVRQLLMGRLSSRGDGA